MEEWMKVGAWCAGLLEGHTEVFIIAICALAVVAYMVRTVNKALDRK